MRCCLVFIETIGQQTRSRFTVADESRQQLSWLRELIFNVLREIPSRAFEDNHAFDAKPYRDRDNRRRPE